MSAAPAISLIIAVYRRADFLAFVLASLEDQTFSDFEVIVADDGSGVEMAATIDRWQGRLAHPIVHEWHEDDGFRKTIIVNRASTRARAEYLVFIDGDCILHNRFLERHYVRRALRRVLTGRRVMMDAALTARITPGDIRSRRIQHPTFWWPHAGKHDRKNGFYMPWMFPLRNYGRSDHQVLGCNFSLHREDFFMVNGYDERIIGRGLEDNNLWVRFVNSGFEVKSVTFEALQYHCHHDADPIPHDAEFIEAYRSSGEARTPYGIVKD